MNTSLGLIAIAGLVGVGKTTLARALARVLSARLILEQYDNNPFRDNPSISAPDARLGTELFFLLGRTRQLNRQIILTADTIVSDYLFQKNRLFAQINLTPEQFALYDELDRVVQATIAPPQLVIYLHDTPENCLDRIIIRGRPYEADISIDWLERLQLAYDNLLDDWSFCPVLRLDCRQFDVRRDEHVRQITSRIHDTILAHKPLTDSVLAASADQTA